MEPTYDPTKQDLQILRDWIKQTPYIPQDYDDQLLTAFFKASKGSLQKTKIVLENYCNLGAKYPEMYQGIDPEKKKLREFLEVAYFFPIPKRTKEGAAILVSALPTEPKDPYKHHVLEVFRLQLMFLLLSIKENNFTSKIIIITDCRGLSLTHMRDLTPSLLTAWMAALENSLPVRIQGIHAFNVPTVVEWVFTLIKKLAKQKISQRIFVHSQPSSLLKHIPEELLPKEYNGKLESSSVLCENWKKTLADNRDFFLNEEKRIRDLDSLRPKSITEEHMAGTFKQLTVD